MTKKYFGTDGIRGKVGEFPITPDFFLKLGWAVGKVFSGKKAGTVLIGKDTRISGYMFESALEAGLTSAGENVLLVGPIPTPGIAYLTRTFHAQAGVVISASHNPYDDNGIKFFSSQGKKLPDEIEFAIESQLSENISTVPSNKIGKVTRVDDAAGRYIEFCKASIDSSINFSDLTIVLDCANGATYHIAPAVFRELGAHVVAELSVKPNGLNINEHCGATRPQALQNEVLEKSAHIGIAFDGDGDRVIMVDADGQVVDGDEILFIIAKHAKAKNTLIGGVVGTLMTNLGMEVALRDLDISFVRAKVGDRYVLELLEEKGWKLGGESSGHIICLDKTTTGDGIIAALQVVAIMQCTGKSLAELKSGMKKFPQIMINVPIKEKINFTNNSAIQQAVKNAEAALGKNGRVLLRASGTEPLIRVMVEGADETLVKKCANDIADVVKAV
jgi:phosphoglucosamine mutase